jgi:hypothetical protein
VDFATLHRPILRKTSSSTTLKKAAPKNAEQRLLCPLVKKTAFWGYFSLLSRSKTKKIGNPTDFFPNFNLFLTL